MTWSHWQGNRGRRRALGATTGSASATSPLPRQPTSIALHEGLGFTPGARIHHPARQRRFPPPPRPRHDDRGVRGEAGRRYWRVGSRATNQRSRRCQQRSFPSCVTRTLRERSRGWARPSASSPSSWCQVRAAVSSTLAWCSGNAWLCSHRSDARARSRPPSARLRNPALSLRPSASTSRIPTRSTRPRAPRPPKSWTRSRTSSSAVESSPAGTARGTRGPSAATTPGDPPRALAVLTTEV